jgi:hypothetical protein
MRTWGRISDRVLIAAAFSCSKTLTAYGMRCGAAVLFAKNASDIRTLEAFFENLLLGTQHELKNRYLHVNFKDETVQSASAEISKCPIGTLDCTLEELAVLKAVKANPTIIQKVLAVAVGYCQLTTTP